MLLHAKTYAFTHQKVAFWKAKGMLLQGKSIGLNKASVTEKRRKNLNNSRLISTFVHKITQKEPEPLCKMLKLMKRILFLLLAFHLLTARAKDYNIVEYGAKNDTTVLSTAALQSAIDDCRQSEGLPEYADAEDGGLQEREHNPAHSKGQLLCRSLLHRQTVPCCRHLSARHLHGIRRTEGNHPTRDVRQTLSAHHQRLSAQPSPILLQHRRAAFHTRRRCLPHALRLLERHSQRIVLLRLRRYCPVRLLSR